MTDYLSLLLKFRGLPRIEQRSTFMEITGYPHYENVCSNILKFYFDPQGEHKMGKLLISAFLRMVGLADLEIPDEMSITREYGTDERKRIDLVVDCATFTLGIENKIHHWEANDLEIYSRRLSQLGGSKRIIKVVLCLKTEESEKFRGGGFVRYTYLQLWTHVRDLMGHTLTKADPKWTLYLLDFMETTTRLTGETQDEKSVTDFFIQHQDVIEKLIADRQQLLNRCYDKVRSVDAFLKSHNETKYVIKQWVCRTDCLAVHYNILGHKICLDLDVSLKGWTLTFFELSHPTQVLRQLFNSPEMVAEEPTSLMRNERYVLQKWDLHANEIELGEALLRWVQALIKAADSATGAQLNSVA